jgi:hypothetical protein
LVDTALHFAGVGVGIGRSLRSVFELLAAGILLPGGFGLADPLMHPPDFSKMKDDQEREIE